MDALYFCRMESPIGPLWISVSEQGVVSVAFSADPPGVFSNGVRRVASDEKTRECRRQLSEYFQRKRRDFDLDLDLQAGTDFQRQCWAALLRIPYGETRSYKDLANEVGHPAASRAVGQANHHNPIAIIIPCHRVITANGQLCGYGGGLPAKKALLELEGVALCKPAATQGSLRF